MADIPEYYVSELPITDYTQFIACSQVVSSIHNIFYATRKLIC